MFLKKNKTIKTLIFSLLCLQESSFVAPPKKKSFSYGQKSLPQGSSEKLFDPEALSRFGTYILKFLPSYRSYDLRIMQEKKQPYCLFDDHLDFSAKPLYDFEEECLTFQEEVERALKNIRITNLYLLQEESEERKEILKKLFTSITSLEFKLFVKKGEIIPPKGILLSSLELEIEGPTLFSDEPMFFYTKNPTKINKSIISFVAHHEGSGLFKEDESLNLLDISYLLKHIESDYYNLFFSFCEKKINYPFHYRSLNAKNAFFQENKNFWNESIFFANNDFFEKIHSQGILPTSFIMNHIFFKLLGSLWNNEQLEQCFNYVRETGDAGGEEGQVLEKLLKKVLSPKEYIFFIHNFFIMNKNIDFSIDKDVFHNMLEAKKFPGRLRLNRNVFKKTTIDLSQCPDIKINSEKINFFHELQNFHKDFEKDFILTIFERKNIDESNLVTIDLPFDHESKDVRFFHFITYKKYKELFFPLNQQLFFQNNFVLPFLAGFNDTLNYKTIINYNSNKYHKYFLLSLSNVFSRSSGPDNLIHNHHKQYNKKTIEKIFEYYQEKKTKIYIYEDSLQTKEENKIKSKLFEEFIKIFYMKFFQKEYSQFLKSTDNQWSEHLQEFQEKIYFKFLSTFVYVDLKHKKENYTLLKEVIDLDNRTCNVGYAFERAMEQKNVSNRYCAIFPGLHFVKELYTSLIIPQLEEEYQTMAAQLLALKQLLDFHRGLSLFFKCQERKMKDEKKNIPPICGKSYYVPMWCFLVKDFNKIYSLIQYYGRVYENKIYNTKDGHFPIESVKEINQQHLLRKITKQNLLNDLMASYSHYQTSNNEEFYNTVRSLQGIFFVPLIMKLIYWERINNDIHSPEKKKEKENYNELCEFLKVDYQEEKFVLPENIKKRFSIFMDNPEKENDEQYLKTLRVDFCPNTQQKEPHQQKQQEVLDDEKPQEKYEFLKLQKEYTSTTSVQKDFLEESRVHNLLSKDPIKNLFFSDSSDYEEDNNPKKSLNPKKEDDDVVMTQELNSRNSQQKKQQQEEEEKVMESCHDNLDGLLLSEKNLMKKSGVTSHQCSRFFLQDLLLKSKMTFQKP